MRLGPDPMGLGPDPGKLLAEHRWQDALTEVRRRLPYWRQLAAKRPGGVCDGLAMALKQQAMALRGLGRPADALPAADEAVAGFRSLAAARPKYAAGLVDGLCLLATLQVATGYRQEAVATALEAMAGYRELVATRPRRVLMPLAATLDDHAALLCRLGDSRMRDTARQRPDDAAWAWLCESVILTGLSRHADAWGSFQRALRAADECGEPQPEWLEQAMKRMTTRPELPGQARIT